MDNKNISWYLSYMDIEDIDWFTSHMTDAYAAARKSKDKRTQVGAVIVKNNILRSKGYNGPVRGWVDDEPAIQKRPDKDDLFEHAERNAIFNSARIGISTEGSTMFSTWHPCTECARAIIQAGIVVLVLHKEAPGNDALTVNQKRAAEMLRRCRVDVRYWSGRVLIDAIRFDGVTRLLDGSKPPAPESNSALDNEVRPHLRGGGSGG
jgi:dCMP deaminase